MKSIKKVTIALNLVAILFSGCALNDNEDSIEHSSIGGETDKLTLTPTNEGFLVTWTKKSSNYGEVVYGDNKYARKLITSNVKGTFFATCKKVQNEFYNCKRSNLRGDYAYKNVKFTEGEQYKWYTTSGFNHTKGSIEAVTESNDGTLTIN